jgi:hypothetical protein
MAREKKVLASQTDESMPSFEELQALALANGWTGATDDQAYAAWKAQKQGPGPCTERFTDQTIADAPPLSNQPVEVVAPAAPAPRTKERDPAHRLAWKRERANALGHDRH